MLQKLANEDTEKPICKKDKYPEFDVFRGRTEQHQFECYAQCIILTRSKNWHFGVGISGNSNADKATDVHYVNEPCHTLAEKAALRGCVAIDENESSMRKMHQDVFKSEHRNTRLKLTSW